jgi:hypothetical protein
MSAKAFNAVLRRSPNPVAPRFRACVSALSSADPACVKPGSSVVSKPLRMAEMSWAKP